VAKEKTYSEKLKDPRWQKKRLEVLQNDEFTCQFCGDVETELHVHHKTYVKGRQPWEYDLTNFVTCCKHCHTIAEDLKKAFSEIPLRTIKRHLPDRDVIAIIAISESVTHGLRLSLCSIENDEMTYHMFVRKELIQDIINLASPYLANL
jgi:hypothetical protein